MRKLFEEAKNIVFTIKFNREAHQEVQREVHRDKANALIVNLNQETRRNISKDERFRGISKV